VTEYNKDTTLVHYGSYYYRNKLYDTGTCRIKYYTTVTDSISSQVNSFVTVIHFHPSRLAPGKAETRYGTALKPFLQILDLGGCKFQ